MVFFAVVSTAFIAEHGGWSGDIPLEEGIPDVVTRDDGIVLFNRWRLVIDREPLFTKAFIVANAPAFGTARLLFGVLESFFEKFQSRNPFGLSFPSYAITLGVLLSSIQWFGIGHGLEFVLRRLDWHSPSPS
jgi:hypothetical protein